ncbi:hypothetical protein BU16DRAFT_520988 [Lophium mytilinum]|uniref:ATPase expression protein 2, mitochondrial n=1 Tax=Lophium mytilinum TaxID=390894 RepID=A0A6A6RFH9_9PEZI|nr:hypothetical protein BU16DRAFT_520988 [Lophium mytilinum]
MSSFLPRVGILESRIASGARSAQSAKRKRWTCPQCQLKGVQQRRGVVALDSTKQQFRKPDRRKSLRTKATLSPFDEHLPADGAVKDWVELKNAAKPSRPSDSQLASQAPEKWDGMMGSIGQDGLNPGGTNEIDELAEARKPPRHYLPDRPKMDYQVGVETALRTKDPELLLQAMVDALTDLDYIHSIPGPTFTEILTLLDPELFIADLRDIHQKISENTQQWLGLAPLKQILNDFSYTFEKIIMARRQTGQELSLNDYRIRLKCAAAVGSIGLARSIWVKMKSSNTILDTQCYNYLLEATVLNRHYLPESRRRERVLPFTLKWRKLRASTGLSEKAIRNQYIPSQSFRVGPGGITDQVNAVFREMLFTESLPNEETFVRLIEGYGREGDMDGVFQILQNLWNVPKILPADYSGVKQLPKDSPIYPSGRLLGAVAHVFGINNRVPQAMQLVDLISRGYGIEISAKIWALFLEWAFILSKGRHHREGKQVGAREGQMREGTVTEIWNTMISPPYNITPTIPMYDFIVKQYGRHGSAWTDYMVHYMVEGAQLLGPQRVALLGALLELTKAEDLAKRGKYPFSLRNLERRVEVLELLRRRNHKTVRKWVDLFLRRNFKSDYNEIPRLISQLEWCVPDHIKYTIEDVGTIEFSVREPEHHLSDEQRFEWYRAQALKNRTLIERILEDVGDYDPIEEELSRTSV